MDLLQRLRSITGKSITASNGKKYSLANLGITTGTDYKEYGQLHIKGDEDDSVYSDNEYAAGSFERRSRTLWQK